MINDNVAETNRDRADYYEEVRRDREGKQKQGWLGLFFLAPL